MTTQPNLSNQDMFIFATQFAIQKKSGSTACILWVFLGWAGGHHFYLGNTERGLLSIPLNIITLGILYIVEGLILYKKVEEYNAELLRRMTLERITHERAARSRK